MGNLSKTTVIILLLVFTHTSQVRAQIDLSKYEIGLTGGIFVYQGDLTPHRIGSYETARPQVAVHIYRVFSPAISVRLNINRGSLHGDDAKYANPVWRRQRNFMFTTPVTELSTHIVWSFLAAKNPRLSPYLFTGVGLSFLRITRDWSKMDPLIFPEGGQVQNGLVADMAKRTPRITPAIPVGAGVRYEINDRFAAVGESAYRFIFTDYLDGFSKAANPNLDDHYLSHEVGVIYKFGNKTNKLGCPALRY